MSDKTDLRTGTGGFQQIGSFTNPILQKVLDPEARELQIEGGWTIVHRVEDLTITTLHGPTGTRSTIMIDPLKGLQWNTFNYYPSTSLRGNKNVEMEAVHRFIWTNWKREGEPLAEYRKRKLEGM